MAWLVAIVAGVVSALTVNAVRWAFWAYSMSDRGRVGKAWYDTLINILGGGR